MAEEIVEQEPVVADTPLEDIDTSLPGLDVAKAVDDISSSLGLGKRVAPEDDAQPAPTQTDAQKSAAAAAARTYDVPKSWAKEVHDLWAKIPTEGQAQITLREEQMLKGLDGYKADATVGKQVKDVFAPHAQLLQQQGVDPVKAVQYFMAAHSKLSTLPLPERTAYFLNLGKTFGINLQPGQGQEPVKLPPEVEALQKRLTGIESALTAQQQSALNAAQAKAGQEVETFASDKAHPYFDEVADDIIVLINAGHELKDAYDKAVWANPVTRAKELARIQKEAEAKLRGKATTEAQGARKALSSNVQTTDTTRSPTEATGKLFGPEHDAEMREIVRGRRTH
jgi:hypothetical protein